VQPGAAVAGDGDRDGLHGAGDAGPEDLLLIALPARSAVDGEHRRAAGLRGPREDLHVPVVVEARADLGGDRGAAVDPLHSGPDGGLHAARLLEGRCAGAPLQGPAGGAAEVQVEDGDPELGGVGRRARDALQVAPHQLNAHGDLEPAAPKVLEHLALGDRSVDDAHELREGAAQVLRGVAGEDDVPERRRGHALHGREQPRGGEGQALHDGGCGRRGAIGQHGVHGGAV